MINRAEIAMMWVAIAALVVIQQQQLTARFQDGGTQESNNKYIATSITQLADAVTNIQTQFGQFVGVQTEVNSKFTEFSSTITTYTKNAGGAWERQEEVNKQYGERLNLLTSILQGR